MTKLNKHVLITIFLCCYIFFLLPSNCFSQEKNWEVNLRDQLYNVSWILQANDGLIIASGDKGLLALNNETGEVKWHQKGLKAINKNSFLNIDGLPLFYIEYQPILNKTRGLLINSSTGEIVFDTKDENYSIKTFSTYPEKACILFEVYKGKEQGLMKFNLKTWAPEWFSVIGVEKGLAATINSSLNPQSFIQHGPYFTSNNYLVVGMKSNYAALNFETGEIAWKKEADRKIKALVYSDRNDKLYLGIRKSKKLAVLEPETGADVTPGKLKLRGSLLDVRPDEKGNLILVETEGFNLIDPETEEFLWKKSFKIDFLDEVIPYQDKYIAIGKNEDKGSIALVNENGKALWDTKVKGYTYYATPTPKGILYISTQRSNILDYEKGKDNWKKDIKFKSIPAITYDDKEDKVILFENKTGYKFDLQAGTIDVFAENIELENVKRKTPLTAEYLSDGYFIGTDQHASVLNPQGNIVYSKYYEPVSSIEGLIGFAEFAAGAALGVDIDIQGNMDNINELTALANGVSQTAGDQNDITSTSNSVASLYTGSNSSTMSPVLEITQRRYFNSKDTQNYKYMTVNTGVNENYIFQLNKNSGEVETKIKLLDKTPDYIIDEIDNRIFLNEKNHLISAYQL